MENCSNHKKEVAGIYNMETVAGMIVNLHHESLAELFNYLPIEFQVASDKDYSIGNNALGYNQKEIADRLSDIKPFAERLWQLSKTHMDKK